MTEREREYVKELEQKVHKYESILEKAMGAPYRQGVIVAGPEEGMYTVQAGGSNLIFPTNPKIGIKLPIGSNVMLSQHLIVGVLSDNLLEKEAPVNFDFIDWSEIGGIKSQMEKIREAVESPYLYKEEYKHFGLKPSKGILLHGAPGCGKTMIAKAIASFLLKGQKISEDSFVYLKGGELLNPYVGVTENRIKAIFDNARANFKKTGQKCVVFIDEAEAILPARGSRRSSDVETTIVPTFLSEMDGFESSETFIILATNHKEKLDPAVIRPGRIDLHVEIDRPNKLDAEEIFAIHLGKTKVEGDMKSICKQAADALFESNKAHQVSGAMIANIAQSSTSAAIKRIVAAKKAGRKTEKNVTLTDILTTIKNI